MLMTLLAPRKLFFIILLLYYICQTFVNFGLCIVVYKISLARKVENDLLMEHVIYKI